MEERPIKVELSSALYSMLALITFWLFIIMLNISSLPKDIQVANPACVCALGKK